MKRAKTRISAIVSLLALAVVLPGCRQKESPVPDAKGGQTEASVEPPRSELRFGMASELATLDPLDRANTADGRAVLFNVYEGLVKPDASGSLLPALAESFGIGQNGLVYSFVLKEGIKFHDGSIVTAEDVQYTLQTAKEAGFDGYGQIEKIEISASGEINVILKEADPEFLPYLTIGVVPKSNPDRKNKPIGTGPFRIESYTPQQSLVLAKNGYYWNKGLPLLDKVTLVFVADSDALQIGLRGGNIDAAEVVGSIVEQLDRNDFDIIEANSNMVQLFALNNKAKPLDDERVRKAINYAVDKKEIIDTAFYGWGQPSGSPLIPGFRNIYESSLANPYPTDEAKAKALLAEAGYEKGFNLEITVPSNYTMHIDTAQVIVNQLGKVGINATIRLVDWATWLSDVYRSRKYEATIISFDGSGVPLSPRSFLGRYVSTAGGNLINFNNADYDSIYKLALKEGEEGARYSLYKQAQRVISDNAASVFIQDIMSFKVYRNGFKGALSYPLAVIDFSTIYWAN
ncbi:ABC transporter substrate-binding protein [Leadbettera azotonutricia]|uniref:Dipeptide-binding protein of ABC transporter n=1 Tax=Leadbettera azotonutricia (strain ATCC BAA-888 / DSM 13862 / ZAS-9) TaxID=545695 RepID=F5Y8C3_LEAAZ|nr:ABC transporter substrate-binding protein [Leadbettera azotonutricia]AEF82498.1 dipeptide-binding protein of ABC transporter [Leadbettera azotonutricia ZAS-9]